jgi:glycine cleavage system H protein
MALGGRSGFGVSGTTTDPRVADGMSPEPVDTDPYIDGWLFRIQFSDPDEISGLLDAETQASLQAD